MKRPARSAVLAICLVAGPSLAQTAPRPPAGEIAIWYAIPADLQSPRFRWPGPALARDVDRHLAALRRAYEQEFVRRAKAPFAALIHAAGARIVYASSFAPAAIVSGDAAALARVRALPEVRHAAPTHDHAIEQNVSAQTTRADAVARLPVPVNGTGVRVCVLEAESVLSANPFLPNVIYFRPPPAVPYGRHPTAVAGIIAAQHSIYPGVSPGVTLLNANAGSFAEGDILRATDWAIRQGTHCINASFGRNTQGVLQLMDRYFDHVVRNLLVNFIKGAGNTGGYVVSPGLGYNSITVGNSFDQKTPHWSDDVVNSSSGYQDPVTGQPKPEIVAPGTQLTGTIDAQPWIGPIGSGGSYAGPQGNGVAALIMQRDARLKLWPEAVKATILASAWHQIQPRIVGSRDGVGQLNAIAADAVVRAGRVRFGNLTPADFDAAGAHDIRLALDPFSETRVVVSWASDPATTSPYSPNPLKMDLDLSVFDPSGSQLASSADRRRSFEIVRFVPPTGGTYTFRLTNRRFDGQTEPFGLAVSQAYDFETASIRGLALLPLNRTSTFTLRDPYHPGRAFAVGASFSGGSNATAFPIGTRAVPLVVDPLTEISLMVGGGGVFAGYTGNLDANGDAALTISLPGLAVLVGLEITQVGITYESSSGELVGITQPVRSRIVP